MSKAMADLMDSITDSPIAHFSSSRGSSHAPRSTPERERPSSPTPSVRPQARQKRPSEDFTQFAKTVGRAMKVRKTDQTELEKFAHYGLHEQNIWLAASLLKVQEKHEALTPPEVRYDVPKLITSKIEDYSFTIIMNPTIAAYLGNKKNPRISPASILVEMLRANPAWGLTQAVYDEKGKFEVIAKSISKKFTNRRCDLKDQVIKSLGDPDPSDSTKFIGALNIVELCEALVGLYKRANLKVSVQMCARIAFIRHFYVQQVEERGELAKFWTNIDLELVRIREMSDNRQTKFFKKIMDGDRARYGQVDLDEVVAATNEAAASSRDLASSATHEPECTEQQRDSDGYDAFDNEEDLD